CARRVETITRMITISPDGGFDYW
nr:immunoglobulin heavy chain junction region [Macaca mulatta]MOV87637.1 immunoglobulin heavy chain junction region [Macaca mulatta]MOV87887.1 immunoglobulin heavy chain junction region [Macaca mulatta]MOV87908.1 immunoglobulin heavy chain junction region [Macaca mulatta]MOV88001.1 immunoglobulin heavy chain junction region [Macaca mulatta]